MRGTGPPFPLLILTTMLINNQGIAKRVAAVLGENEELQNDG